MNCLFNTYGKEIKSTALKLVLLLFFAAGLQTMYGQNINEPNKKGILGTEVNTFSGNLFLPRNDLYLPAHGFALNVSFYYNSFQFDQNTNFGNGWTLGYAIRYSTDTVNNKTVTWGDGDENIYTLMPDGSYRSPRGYFTTFTQYQPGKYLLADPDGAKYYFDNATHKRITRMEERNGNYVNFNYTDTLLTSIVNKDGQLLSFTYDALGRISTMVDAISSPSRSWTYTYDNSNNLMQVKDPLGNNIKYTYLVNGPLKTLSDKNSNTVDIIYYPDYTVSELIGCNKRQSFSYDTTNNVSVVTEYVPTGSNQVSTYHYKAVDGSGWLTSVSTNCCGYDVSFEFDDQGNKIKQIDANGNTSYFTYDARGNVLTMKDPLGQIMSYTYSADFNEITSYTDAKGYVTTLTYNNTGNITKLTEPGGLVYAAAYNTKGDIINSTDPKGNVFSYTYDTYGNPVSVTGPEGYQATLNYDARGNLLTFTDSKGNANNLEYDILSRVKKVTDPINNTVFATWDAAGNLVTLKDQNNESSSYKYDASNRIVEHTDPMKNRSTMTYDAMDNIIEEKNALNNASSFTYDTKNRFSGAKDALGNSATMAYDAKGNMVSAVYPNGERLSYTYDVLDRLVSVADLTGTIATLQYDKNNNVTSYVNGTGATTTAEYDSLNRMTKLTDPLGNSFLYVYDKDHNIISVTDRNGFTRSFTYDNLNRVKTYTDKNNAVTTLSYDTEGNITALKDQNNNTTAYVYDNLDRLKTITYPDAKFIQYTYDAKGNITAKRLPDGNVINFTYDSLYRILTRALPDGQVFTYTYDALGRVKTATNNAGTVSFTYDALDRLASETFDGRTISYTYNTTGRTQTIIYPDSTTIVKTYDTRNRLTGISKGTNNIVSYQFNNADQVTTKIFGNGVSTNLQYDFDNRLSNFSTSNGNIQNTVFAYDKQGNKLSIGRQDSPSLSEQFAYDNGNRVLSYKRGVVGGSPTLTNTYTYDALGNRVAANLNGINNIYTINNLNQITSLNNGSAIAFTHDDNGNLTYDGHFYKKYNAEGRLLRDSSSPANVYTYQYDALGRRIGKTVNGVPFKYTYAGTTQIEERNGITNDILNRTVYANMINPVLNENNNNSFYYHQNEMNSVEAITNSSGSLVEKYQYDLYGKQTIYDAGGNMVTKSSAGNRFGYTGQEYDSATRSNHFYFRDYSSATGTFDQRDPVNYADGMGMYQYVHDNPANGIDIFGLDDCDHQDPAPKKPKYEYPNSFPGWLQWVGSNIASNVNSVTTVMQGNTVVHVFNFENGYTVRQFGGSFIKGMNSTGMGMALAPVNVYAAYSSMQSLSDNWSSMNTGQAVDGVMGTGGSMVFGGMSLYSSGAFISGAGNAMLFEGAGFGGAATAGATSFGGAISAGGAGFVIIGVAGGLAIFGVINEGTKMVSGKSIAEHGQEMEIPIFTGTVRWFSGGNYAPDPPPPGRDNHWKPNIINCPNNNTPGGPKRRRYFYFKPNGDSVEVISSRDPNEMIGPDGQPSKKWVSVKDRMPYTILFENDRSATAPAKFVRVITPMEPKQDATTFQLSSFGFNDQTFSISAGTASSYQRLDCRDSLGLYVDVTAGYDQLTNQAFWDFQCIDPVTLLPPADPLKGFLLKQDSTHPNFGHGFVNFSTKPVPAAVTLDTIGARANIVFDSNDTIPTNIATNTIDAFAPTSHMNVLPGTSTNPVALSWGGVDDLNGCGVKYYTLYASTDGINFNILRSNITRTDTTFIGAANTTYFFFVLATDSVGNTEVLRPGEVRSTFIGSGPLPITWLYFRGTNQDKDNLLEWATATEQNSKEFKVQRSLNGTTFSTIGAVAAAGNSNTTTNYHYNDLGIDKLSAAVMYYRLQQLDINGNFKYSNIIRLNYNVKDVVNSLVYPNPTQGMITITVGDATLVGTDAMLVDENGRTLERIKINANSQSINMAKYVNGVYFIQLKNKEVLKIVKM